jgi:hypothetical protein
VRATAAVARVPVGQVVEAPRRAFVFYNVSSDYNVASQAIDSECASLHGIAILSDHLPSSGGLSCDLRTAASARSLIDFLTAPAAARVYKANGMDPAGAPNTE